MQAALQTGASGSSIQASNLDTDKSGGGTAVIASWEQLVAKLNALDANDTREIWLPARGELRVTRQAILTHAHSNVRIASSSTEALVRITCSPGVALHAFEINK